MITQVTQVNDQVDISATDLRTAAGTQGTLTAFLQVSLQPDGTLTAAGVDGANHSIEAHHDTTNYVRMLASERAKLALIASNATNINLLFETDNVGNVTYTNGTADFANSSTVSWRYTTGKLYLDTAFPGIGHRYNQIPATSDYQNFTVPVLPFNGNTLRVYVNGVRLTPGYPVQYPSTDVTPVWTLLTYSELTPSSGTFALSAPVTGFDVVVVDYDYSY